MRIVADDAQKLFDALITGAERTFAKPCFRLPVHSSVGDTWRGFVRRSEAVPRPLF
jgi:hypothetical protein